MNALLDRFFSWLVHTSWEASVVVLLVLGAQFLFKRRLPARWRYALWFLVVLRLIVPALPHTPFSLHRFPKAVATVSNEQLVKTFGSFPPSSPVVTGAERPMTIPEQNEPKFQWLSLGNRIYALLWLTGALAFAAATLVNAGRFAVALRRSRPCQDDPILAIAHASGLELGLRRDVRIVTTPLVSGPAMVGIFRPTLLLPEGLIASFSPAELHVVFLHEFAHLRRGDMILNALLVVLQILHWFNPVMWFAFSRMRHDRELATDALVLSETRSSLKTLYGHTLLKLIEGFNSSLVSPRLVGIMENPKDIKDRLVRITQATPGAYRRSILGLTLLAVIGVTALTQGMADPTPPATPATPSSGESKASETKTPQSPNPPIKTIKERVRERFDQDRQTYTPEQLKEIEGLYQTANKQWQSPEAKAALKVLIEKYAKANRTGCALLYLGQMTSGADRENYLKEAIQNHSDCLYGDGVQVGAYARLYLADYYLKSGKTDEAKALLEQIRKDYPDAVDHSGRPLSASIERLLNPPVLTPQQTKNVERATERFEKDRKTYTPEQFKELESLYQMANKELGSPGAKEVLKKVIGKYPQSNRAGCALMYLAQRAKGEEQENYLKEAIQNHSDCFYGDGVQVGAFARFYLADYYLKIGKTDEAKALLEQIRKDYPDAVDHSGKPLMRQSK